MKPLQIEAYDNTGMSYSGTFYRKYNVLMDSNARGKSYFAKFCARSTTISSVPIIQADLQMLDRGMYDNFDYDALLVIDEELTHALEEDRRKSHTKECKHYEEKLLRMKLFILIIDRENYAGMPIDYRDIYKVQLSNGGCQHTFVRKYPEYNTLSLNESSYLVEDSSTGYLYYASYLVGHVQSARGNSNVPMLCKHKYVIADGTAFGPFIYSALKHQPTGLFLPISFEYSMLCAYLSRKYTESKMQKWYQDMMDSWDFESHLSLERYFTYLLGLYLEEHNFAFKYSKSKLELPMLKCRTADLDPLTLNPWARYCIMNEIPFTALDWEEALSRLGITSPYQFNVEFYRKIEKKVDKFKSLLPSSDKTLSTPMIVSKYYEQLKDFR